MKVLLSVAALVLLGLVLVALFVRHKLARMGEHLPGAMERWEEEIKNLEKPKG